MLERIKEEMKSKAKALWCHRVFYAGIAGVYSGALLGLDSKLVYQALIALYAGLVLKG